MHVYMKGLSRLHEIHKCIFAYIICSLEISRQLHGTIIGKVAHFNGIFMSTSLRNWASSQIKFNQFSTHFSIQLSIKSCYIHRNGFCVNLLTRNFKCQISNVNCQISIVKKCQELSRNCVSANANTFSIRKNPNNNKYKYNK